ENTPVLISHGVTVQLDGADHAAESLVVHGNLVVPEEDQGSSEADKTLTTQWVHVNSGGLFQVGTEIDRYDTGTFALQLTGTDIDTDKIVQTNKMGMNPGTMTIKKNDGFLMTAGMGRVEFFGDDKISFTKLAATAIPNDDRIVVANIIERNFSEGASDASGFVTSAVDDGELNWAIGDKIVIASSSYDYTEQEVRSIIDIVPGPESGTSTLVLDASLNHRHYGEIETYGANTSQPRSFDMRAEVALLSRNIKIHGLDSQDTDVQFGDRGNMVTEPRVRAAGLSDAEAAKAPGVQVANGIGGHIMIMPTSGPIKIDGVQLDRMGQASQKGRYPIHWHLGDSRPNDFLKNTSVTNSNNRGVTIHGTSDLTIEGVVLHDVHGHGFFFEDAVETGNKLVANLAIGIHTVGGNDDSAADPGEKDPFIVDTHDSVLETGSRFSSSAAFWITHPDNKFVGNIVAGMGDQRTDKYADPDEGVAAGTGFWYAIPRVPLGASSQNPIYADMTPIYGEFGGFDYNTSHTAAVGLNFDRGSDIEDATFLSNPNLGAIQLSNVYSPRIGGVKEGVKTTNVVQGFTNYKASQAAFYHRGDGEQIQLDGLAVADSYNGPWAVSENTYRGSLFVGHSKGNADLTAEVGGPRLYDGAGLYIDTHFAGFAESTAYAFQVEGSSFGPTMYHAFQSTSFENDGTANNLAHAVSDFSSKLPGRDHNEGQPSEWIKAVMDLDGTLTSAFDGGGVGTSIVPDVDFLIDDD
ncbi:MAG: G8 domain-containing protein, partial [Rubripirellula sp.]